MFLQIKLARYREFIKYLNTFPIVSPSELFEFLKSIRTQKHMFDVPDEQILVRGPYQEKVHAYTFEAK